MLRDADILPELAADLPPELSEATKMVVRLDRRLGFDPTRPWELRLQAVRQHGMFQAEVGSAHFPVTLQTPERFFLRPAVPERLSPFAEALRNRASDLWVLGGFLGLLIAALLAQSRLAGLKAFTPVRLTILALVISFVGFWGAGAAVHRHGDGGRARAGCGGA
ncbi:hypothetical protein ACTTAF_08775 [Rhodobacter capsulatus]|uniref:hypothetical protein n=1 Tax=Rhodobacter capsulatus TaxID=1061 RepID=UPI004038A663